jgi:membrane protein
MGTYESLSEDRVLAVAAGVTFYGLLALFPAIAALVSLYGLFADPQAIQTHLQELSSVLPGGAVEIIGDQIKRVASAGTGTLGVSSAISIAIAFWGANAGVKAMFDALNVAYGTKEERGFVKLNLTSLAFTIGAIAFAILALGAVVVLPLVLRYVGSRLPTRWTPCSRANADPFGHPAEPAYLLNPSDRRSLCCL